REVAKVVLGGDRDQIEIYRPPNVARMEAVAIEEPLVVRHVLVGIRQQPPQLGVLERLERNAVRPRMALDGSRRPEQGRATGDHRTALRGARSATAADGPRPSSPRARAGVASLRPNVSLRSATRSTSPRLVASSPRSNPWKMLSSRPTRVCPPM